jgi:hypothetical protein
MPFNLDHLYSGGLFWERGDTACAIWVITDTVVCTASIWHLAAIALDRLTVRKFIFPYMLYKYLVGLKINIPYVLDKTIKLLLSR